MLTDTKRTLVRWLQTFRRDAVVFWGEDGLSLQHPYAYRAADPVVADCPVAWPWRILGPDAPRSDVDGATTIVLPYDLDIYSIWPAGPCSGPFGEWRTSRDEPLTVEDARAVERARALPGATLVLSGGWRVKTLSGALDRWVADHAGRPDLRFAWSPNEQSWVVRTGRRLLSASPAGAWPGGGWALFFPATVARGCPECEQWRAERRARAAHRRVDARRWLRRLRVDPSLRWVTPGEVRMLADLDPFGDVYAWAAARGVRQEPGSGLEPRFATMPVLEATLAAET